MWRKMEALRDRLMHGTGSDEPWFLDEQFQHEFGSIAVSAHWRKPLRVDEVNLLAPTTEVRNRPGRP